MHAVPSVRLQGVANLIAKQSLTELRLSGQCYGGQIRSICIIEDADAFTQRQSLLSLSPPAASNNLMPSTVGFTS